MKQSLHSGQRIRAERIFQLLFKQGKFAGGAHVRLWVYAGPEVSDGPGPKLGIVVSRKTDLRATKRNLWKRRIREIFRRRQNEIRPEVAVLIQSKMKQMPPPFSVLEIEIFQLLKKAGGLLK